MVQGLEEANQFILAESSVVVDVGLLKQFLNIGLWKRLLVVLGTVIRQLMSLREAQRAIVIPVILNESLVDRLSNLLLCQFAH